jgi:hypothetical protein
MNIKQCNIYCPIKLSKKLLQINIINIKYDEKIKVGRTERKTI